MFVGWAIGCVFMTPYADRHGRRTPFLVSSALCTGAWAASMSVTNYHIYLIFALIHGITKAGLVSIGYVMYVENLPKSHRIKYGVLMEVIFAATNFLVGLWFQFISQDWIVL